MEPKITTRSATSEDKEFARGVHHQAYHDVIVKQFGSWDESVQDVFFNKSWNPETHKIIQSDGSSCGYYHVEHTADYIFLHTLVLALEFQGKGIGSIILKELIEESQHKNIPLRLQVFKENQAQHLYRKLGFKDVGTTDKHFEMEFSPVE